MPVIPPRERQAIQQRFQQELAGRVRIDYFTQRRSSIIIPGREDCRFCDEVDQALHDVAQLHPRLTLTVHEFHHAPEAASRLGVARVPCTVIRGQANRPLRFYGLPGGWQFPNLIETIVLSSGPKAPVDREASIVVKRLRKPVEVTVFVTPACEYSAPVANAAYRLALAHANIRSEVVEAGEFAQLAQRFDIRATPLTVFDDRLSVRGRIDEVAIARHALQSTTTSMVTAIDAGPCTPFDPGMFDEPLPKPDPDMPGIYVPGR